MVELPDDLVLPVEELDTVNSLAACLPRVLSELSADDREVITLCDLQGMTQAHFAAHKGLEPERSAIPPATRPPAFTRAHDSRLSGANHGAGHLFDFVPRAQFA